MVSDFLTKSEESRELSSREALTSEGTGSQVRQVLPDKQLGSTQTNGATLDEIQAEGKIQPVANLSFPNREQVTAPKLAKRSLHTATSKVKEQFLQLHLASETIALLPTKQLTEVLNIAAEQIMPIPHMSPWMMGTYNWRGKLLWLVDVGYLVGLTPLYQQVLLSYTATILQFSLPTNTSNDNKNQIIGLVVNQVGSIERCHPDSIQPSSFSATDNKLAKFLRGYWLKSEGEILAVFDPDAIWREISQSSKFT